MNIKKLCVGIESVKELKQLQLNRQAHNEPVCAYTTNKPKQAQEVIDSGSLYWVIKGAIRARQKVIGFGTWTDMNGKVRATILLDVNVIETENHPHRPFQGWRYLKPTDIPKDIDLKDYDLSDSLAESLKDLGAL